ncbi:heavy-metal-associated domain-containing protein [Rhodococcus pyridinivorans]|uniref:heavy-metal-associated domain-containing protein n=1 Tax=Rhodococcus pyridinivorans TaxID=103816 RepID=UPI00207885C7|nr:heavy metal transporter [Rhodococcus pyridinivorans]USI92972.1 heavy metal transporter [Rhodococcus pyridinivorans]
MAANEYQVAGMTCGHCEMSVREEVGDVDDAQVLAVIPRDVVNAVEDAGYSAVRA